jgi:hypothetical protein
MAEKRPLEIASQAIDSAEREDPDPMLGGGAWLNAHSTVKGATRLAFAALAALESAGFRIVGKDDPRLAAPMAVATNVTLRVSVA